MRKYSFEIFVGFLVAISVALVLALGYFSYSRISTIVANIHEESQPDEKLALIKSIATDLDRAENSIRLYGYTKSKKDLKPFNDIIANIDEQINSLQRAGAGNDRLQKNVDTISSLITDKIYVWQEMLSLYDANVADQYLDTIAVQLESKIESDSIRKSRGILKKIFQRKKKQEIDEQKIMEDIAQFKEEDKKYTAQVKQNELELARTNNKLTVRIYNLIDKMEEEELIDRGNRAEEARRLAEETYRWIGWFILSGTVLAIIVIFVILNYVRKSRTTQKALISAKNQAENLARAKEMFMANVSHEIRTPMNVISGFLDQLLKKPIEESIKDTLQIIKSSSDHLVRIINDILDFSKLQSGKMKLEQTDFNPRDFMQEIRMLFENQANENNTKLLFEVHEKFPEVILGDPIRLKQILINLIGNAIKFTKNGTVSCKITAEDQISNNLVMNLVVEDTGIGIGEENLEKIFEDFTQAESDTSRKFGGTGLGLSIVKQLIDLHQGKIRVESQKNQGSKFICKIPYKLGNLAYVEHKQLNELDVPDAIKQQSVLIVDDEVYNRKLIRTILDKWEVKSEEAEDGMDAIEKVKTNTYDFILMDVRMPGLDGFKVTQFIRQTLKLSPEDTAIILISAASASREEIKQYKTQGINDYLPKPFDEALLLKSMRAIIEGEKMTTVAKAKNFEEKPNPEHTIHFKELYRVADNDTEFIKEMLEQFLESFEHGLGSIKESMPEKNWDSISNAAHKMASPCRHIGAHALLNDLKQIEKLANNHTGYDTIFALIPQIDMEYKSVKKQILNHIDELKK
ncbi:MAG: response regulator [Bacteroidetes bacterium]|nr:response regulator [Bacteroidota bacterium]